MGDSADVVDAQLVQVVAQFPPRADAFVTLVASDDYLPGAQTLLYSIQKCLDKTILYPPELVVMVTPEVSPKTRQALCPALCTRILEVEVLALPTKGIHNRQQNQQSTPITPMDNDCPGLTKLHAFRQVVYDTIVFIEPDCLVLDDLYPLLKRGKLYTETEALVAAAPDLFPPDKFNSGVMVIRPSQQAFDNMMGQRTLLANYDNSDTGFLNAYFSEWHTEMAPLARLPFAYNAQRALYDNSKPCWEHVVSPDLKIIHYSGNPKPWETVMAVQSDSKPTHKTGDYLTDLWRQWHQRSKNYAARQIANAKKQEAWKASAEVRHKQQEQQQQQAAAANPKQVHKMVTKRFKELRQQGHDVKEAMAQARAEQGLDDAAQNNDDKAAVGAQVASMFGVMM